MIPSTAFVQIADPRNRTLRSQPRPGQGVKEEGQYTGRPGRPILQPWSACRWRRRCRIRRQDARWQPPLLLRAPERPPRAPPIGTRGAVSSGLIGRSCARFKPPRATASESAEGEHTHQPCLHVRRRRRRWDARRWRRRCRSRRRDARWQPPFLLCAPARPPRTPTIGTRGAVSSGLLGRSCARVKPPRATASESAESAYTHQPCLHVRQSSASTSTKRRARRI